MAKMNIRFVDLGRQLYGDCQAETQGIMQDIQKSLAHCLTNTLFTMGSLLEKFEQEFALYCGKKYCVGLNSGTDALEFSLRCQSITSGKVITVPNTYFTGASSINNAGLMPVFVDVDPRTFNMDVGQLEAAIDSATQACIVSHLYGRPGDMQAIQIVARKHGLVVIEDCAHAHGARYYEKRVPIDKTGAFSFFPAKNIGAWGDGGALVTDDAEVARLARLWRNDGSEVKYHHEILGRKARLDTLQAVILSAKLPYLDCWNEQRRKHAAQYTELLSHVEEIQLPLLGSVELEPVFHIYNILTKKRDALKDYLTVRGIETIIHYPAPIHLQPAYDYLGLKEGSFPVSEKLAKTTLSLPMFPELREDEITYVSDAIKRFFRG